MHKNHGMEYADIDRCLHYQCKRPVNRKRGSGDLCEYHMNRWLDQWIDKHLKNSVLGPRLRGAKLSGGSQERPGAF